VTGPSAWWLTGLPKAEVHLHLEGCLDGVLVTRAAERHGVPPHPAWEDGRPVISSLGQLLDYLDWSCALIDQPDELFTVAYDTALRAGVSGARHVDAIVNPTHWPAWRGRLGPMVDALDAGFAAAEQDGQATATLCLSVKRSQSRQEALDLVAWMLEVRHRRVSALSVDGDESGGSNTPRFVEAFAEAAQGGLRTCAHAGESSGAQGVREAVELLGAERIDHGVRCAEDPSLVAELARRGVPLDICPTSNVVLGVVPSLAAHPIEPLRRAGVRVSVNTDDPLLYGIDLAGEYRRCTEAFGWDEQVAAQLARTSIESCFADEDRRRQLLAQLDAYMGGPPHGDASGAEETGNSHSSA